jgi:hypothetical protein
MSGPSDPTTQPDSRPSLGELFSDVATDLTTLARQEVQLAKAELRQSAARSGKGAGLLAGAGVSGSMTLLFGWSALIVAATWLIIAAALGLTGRRELSAVSGIPQTAQTVKKSPDAVRGNEGTS